MSRVYAAVALGCLAAAGWGWMTSNPFGGIPIGVATMLCAAYVLDRRAG